jgi:ParB family chromosome partitioning protein
MAMDTENRLRKDISPYERALSYARWLRSGHFQSQDDIARALKISPSQVSRILQLAQLPTVVVEAFGNPTEIREKWGHSLLSKLEEPRARQALVDAARAIVAKKERIPAKDVYRQLLTASTRGRKLKPKHHDVVVRAENGATLFRIRHQRDAVALLLPLENVAERTLREISSAVAHILQAASAQITDSSAITRSHSAAARASRAKAREATEEATVPAPM